MMIDGLGQRSCMFNLGDMMRILLLLLCCLSYGLHGCLKTGDEDESEESMDIADASVEQLESMEGAEQSRDAVQMNGDEASMARITWIDIPAGSFMMGSTDVSDEQPVRQVTVQAFQMSESEVTVGQYRQCVVAARCTEPSTGNQCTWSDSPNGKEDYPINCIDWGQARTFAVWMGGDLPTEAQWEYAARGGDDYEYAGSNMAGDFAWYAENSEESNQVRTKRANGYGLYDMSGNVREWVLDEWHENYEGAPNQAERPWGEVTACDQLCEHGASWHVNRGGSWYDFASSLRVTYRYYDFPGNRDFSLGFRIVQVLP